MQGWLDLPEDDLHEKLPLGGVPQAQGRRRRRKWVRRWFVLRNTVLNMYTEEQKEKSDLKQPIFALAVSDMRSAVRAKGSSPTPTPAPTPTPTSTPHPHPTPTPAPTPCQVRAKGVHFYKRGLLLEKSDGTVITMRAAGQISLYLPIPPYISLRR